MMHAKKGLVCTSDHKFWGAAAYERTSLQRKDLQYLTDQLSPVVMDLFVNLFFFAAGESLIHYIFIVLLPTPLRIFHRVFKGPLTFFITTHY